ncbi:glucokinase [Pedobacter sp. CG_S7]|uniref:ROK family protein n=1 Tax=Pedobacter sp. CG_S7 TaxID=3143930 RepID=UPI00339437CF
MKDFVLGIDIGGSHITAALVDLETQTIVEGSSQRLAVNSKDTAERILTSWCEVINAAFLKVQNGNKRIGIAMPGPFDYEAGICLIQDQDKFKSLYQLNLKNELASLLNIDAANIRFVNDAAGFLQGEVFAGAAREGKQVIGLTLGTGLGSAFCENSIAVDAALWQLKFKAGIAEDYLSTRWFVDRYFQLTGQEIAGVKELMSLENQAAVRKLIFEEFSNNLVDFLSPLIKERHADMVVLGGNIAQSYLAFLPDVKRKLQENKVIAQVKIAELKEDASLIGAASCWELRHH